jgi:hypothetical protein
MWRDPRLSLRSAPFSEVLTYGRAKPASRVEEPAMVVAAKLYRAAGERDERMAVALDATVRNPAAAPLDATVLDISASGLRAFIAEELAIGDAISVGLSGIGRVAARVIRRSGHEYGCQFLQPISPEKIAQALAADTVVQAPFAPLPTPVFDEEDDRLPVPLRLAVIVGTSLLLWTAILAAGWALIA